MIAAVFILILLTVAAIAFLIAPRLTPARVVFDETADAPISFGPGMSWLAIRSKVTGAVIAALQLTGVRPANWDSGIGTIYDPGLSDAHVFVSPPVRGWIFVAGVPLPHPVGRNFVDKLSPLLADLAAQFSGVHYFATFPIIDFFAWARLEKGHVVRAFAIGEEGVVWDRGRLTREEKALGLKLFEVRGIKGRKGDVGGAIMLHPTQDQVLRLAGAWGLNPAHMDAFADAKAAVGRVARAPSQWRSERLRKAA